MRTLEELQAELNIHTAYREVISEAINSFITKTSPSPSEGEPGYDEWNESYNLLCHHESMAEERVRLMQAAVNTRADCNSVLGTPGA